MKQLFLFIITSLVLYIFRYLSFELQNNFLEKPLMAKVMLAILSLDSMPNIALRVLINLNMFFWWAMFSSLVAFIILAPLFMKFNQVKLSYFVFVGLFCGAMHYPLSFGLPQPNFLGINGYLVICISYALSAAIAYGIWKLINLKFNVFNHA